MSAAIGPKALAGICRTPGCRETVAMVGDIGAQRAFDKCRRCLVNPGWGRRAADAKGFARLAPWVTPAGALGFRLPGVPVGVNRAFQPRRRGHHMAIGLTPEAQNFKLAVRAYALQARPAGWDPTGAFTLDLHSVFTSPLADRDGPLKLVQDALQGIAYGKDVQVVGGSTTKGPPDGAPRLEVIVRRLP